jgi:hypothetical protein
VRELADALFRGGDVDPAQRLNLVVDILYAYVDPRIRLS